MTILALSLLAAALPPAPQGGGLDLLRTDDADQALLLGDMGDVDLDGIPDYVASEESGSAMFVLSGASGTLLYDGFTVSGFPFTSLEVLGDLNGDGIPELGMGAPQDGRVNVVNGLLDFELQIFFQSVGFGSDIASVGDLDGDSVPDFLVGSPEVNSGSGEILAYSGATFGTLWQLLGFEAGAGLGSQLAALGDVDSDGVPDFAVSAPDSNAGAVQGGSVKIVSGAGFQTLGSFEGQALERFGTVLASVGDLDGDGIEDLAASADSLFAFRPVVRALSGADGSLLWEIQGAIDTHLGSSLAGAGDWNGDGVPEVAVGDNDPLSPGDGQVLILSGVDGEELYRSAPAPGLGSELLGLDLTGDGRHEILAADQSPTVKVYGFNPFLLLPDGAEVSASQGGIVGLLLDFPAEAGSYSYQMLFSLAGEGSTSVWGLEVPLAFDSLFLRSFFGDYGFLPYATGMTGTLDGNGDAAAALGHPGGLPASWVGRTLAFAAVAGPSGLPPTLSSAALSLVLVP